MNPSNSGYFFRTVAEWKRRKMVVSKKKPLLLKASSISKKFSHVEALNNVDIEVRKGSVLAIVGDNGAGKSTLIKILSGALTPDRGTICINEKIYKYLTPKQALSEGISTVYQDLALADTRDVASNIFLGSEETVWGFLWKKKMKQKAEALIKTLEVKIPDVSVPVGILSGGQRQGVAILRAIHQGGKILIFDEPTAAMGLVEAGRILKLIKKLSDEGFGVVIISHNLHHVFQIADEIAIMRQGKVLDCIQKADSDVEQVVSMITGAIDIY